MRYLRKIGLTVTAALALTGLFGVAQASATTLEIGGSAKNEAITITASLKSGSSAVLRDTLGFTIGTCTGTHIHIHANTPSGSKVTGPVEEMTITGCSSSVTTHKPGQLYIEWISGTNGRVYSEEAEWTVFSLIHGTYISCKTGIGTPIGTLTGVKEGHATIDINATINCEPHLGSSKWTATYTLTSPTGLGVVA